jgi:hypothetical protein
MSLRDPSPVPTGAGGVPNSPLATGCVATDIVRATSTAATDIVRA